MMHVSQQVLSIETEIQGYKRDIVKQQIANEAVTAVLKKVEGEAGFVTRQIETCLEKQSRLAGVWGLKAMVALTACVDTASGATASTVLETHVLASVLQACRACDRAATLVCV